MSGRSYSVGSSRFQREGVLARQGAAVSGGSDGDPDDGGVGDGQSVGGGRARRPIGYGGAVSCGIFVQSKRVIACSG